MDTFQYLAHFRADELRSAAGEYRATKPARLRRRRIGRLYARLWWASRPRAATWAPALLEAPG